MSSYIAINLFFYVYNIASMIGGTLDAIAQPKTCYTSNKNMNNITREIVYFQ